MGMMNLWHCFMYLCLIGILGFFIGRILPKGWFHPDGILFRTCAFEKNGTIYNRLKVKRWMNKVPDMSRILPGMMPPKSLSPGIGPKQLDLAIRETCIAEFVHLALGLLGFFCVLIWEGIGGRILALLYLIGNLPYIIIQRYNRPKLMRVAERLREKESIKESHEEEGKECTKQAL